MKSLLIYPSIKVAGSTQLHLEPDLTQDILLFENLDGVSTLASGLRRMKGKETLFCSSELVMMTLCLAMSLQNAPASICRSQNTDSPRDASAKSAR
jgi:hypothetical protein